MIELLAPAGDSLRAKVAYAYGADAVFVGGKRFSLRAKASNFDLDQIKELAQYAHAKQKKLFVTVNMLAHEDDLVGLETYLKDLDAAQVDAIIVASLSMVKIAKALKLNFELHLSTQLSITNSKALEFYKRIGVDRVVLARELDITAVQQLQTHAILDTEIFIHGGMCVNYSGRCTLSNEMTLRDANRGGCAQSCRWYYRLKVGDEIISPEKNPFTMGSKDLSTLNWIEDFVKAKVSSLKIEGRMKSSYYLAVVVSTYRQLIDAIEAKEDVNKLMPKLQKELEKAEGRLTFDGFYGHLPSAQDHLYLSQKTQVLQSFVGQVISQEEGWIQVELKNAIHVGDRLELFDERLKKEPFILRALKNELGEAMEFMKIGNTKPWLYFGQEVSNFAFVRKETLL